MQVYFKNIQSIILGELGKARQSILVAVCWFNDIVLFEKLLEVSKSNQSIGIQVFVTENATNFGFDGLPFKKIHDAGIQLYIIPEDQALMHHKLCIVDEKIVVNGSYNWTYGAKNNMENVIVFEDSSVANEIKVEILRLKDIAKREIPFIEEWDNHNNAGKSKSVHREQSSYEAQASKPKDIQLHKAETGQLKFKRQLHVAPSPIKGTTTVSLEKLLEDYDIKSVEFAQHPCILDQQEFISLNRKKINWDALSTNPRLPQYSAFIKEFAYRFNWKHLSYNIGHNASQEGLSYYIYSYYHRIDWQQLSEGLSRHPLFQQIKKSKFGIFNYKVDWENITQKKSQAIAAKQDDNKAPKSISYSRNLGESKEIFNISSILLVRNPKLEWKEFSIGLALNPKIRKMVRLSKKLIYSIDWKVFSEHFAQNSELCLNFDLVSVMKFRLDWSVFIKNLPLNTKLYQYPKIINEYNIQLGIYYDAYQLNPELCKYPSILDASKDVLTLLNDCLKAGDKLGFEQTIEILPYLKDT